jgi:hypothetical protein
MVKAGREFLLLGAKRRRGQRFRVDTATSRKSPNRPRVVITTRSTTRCPGAQLTIPLTGQLIELAWNLVALASRLTFSPVSEKSMAALSCGCYTLA